MLVDTVQLSLSFLYMRIDGPRACGPGLLVVSECVRVRAGGEHLYRSE